LLVNAAARGVFTILFPSDCRFCGAPLNQISRLPVCEDCLAAMIPRQGVVCTTCGERLQDRYAVNDRREPICGECLAHEPEFVKAAAYGSYEGGLRELILLLKYDRVRPAAGVLGRMLSEAIADLDPGFGELAPVVVPVPLYAGSGGSASHTSATGWYIVTALRTCRL
jgi:predicted amidophosphoribosyltransferase